MIMYVNYAYLIVGQRRPLLPKNYKTVNDTVAYFESMLHILCYCSNT